MYSAVDPSYAFGRSSKPNIISQLALLSAIVIAAAALSEPTLERTILSPGSPLTSAGLSNETLSVVRTALRAQIALSPISAVIIAAWYTCVAIFVALTSRLTLNIRAFWALGLCAATVDPGITNLARGVIEQLRGPSTVQSAHDLYFIVPSLALLTPSDDPHVLTLLAALNPFVCWAAFVLAKGFAAITGGNAISCVVLVFAALVASIGVAVLAAR